MAKKVALLASGGVDSSVAMGLLKEQGYEVEAFYLKIWLEDELSFLGECPWQEDVEFLEQICENLQVPLHVVPMQKEYFERVVGYTIDSVKKGLTPNPDVMCNNHIKFGFFLETLPEGFDYVASGHYAQTGSFEGRSCLKQACDPIKDQTYFLSQVPFETLPKILFPIGHLSKPQVRKEAERLALPNMNRKDSQGICFLGKLKFNEFIHHYLGDRNGDIVEFESGEKVGEHKGFYYHTRGQRKGLGLSGGPWYVVSKDTEKNTVFVSKNYELLSNARMDFKIDSGNFVVENWYKNPGLKVKLRHGPTFYNCTIEPNAQGFNIYLNQSDQGISPEQFAVFYLDDIVLGSATICE